MNYPEKNTSDKIADGMNTAAQLIPFGVGGAISEAIKSFVPVGYEHRRDKWFQSIALKLENLPEETVNMIRTYIESEEGNTLLIRATMAAISTHKQDKYNAIRDVLLETIRDVNMHYDQKEMFISVISLLEPYDLALLNIINSKNELFESIESYEDAFTISKENGFKGERDEFIIILNRLEANSLLRVSEHIDGFGDVYSVDVITTEATSSLPKVVVTNFASQLMTFITDEAV